MHVCETLFAFCNVLTNSVKYCPTLQCGFQNKLLEVIMNKINEFNDSPYLTIRDFSKQYPTWTESSIRWLIYNNTAGFNEIVVRRIGKNKILLSIADFWRWVERQNQKNNDVQLIASSK
jgi:hypothetical protein